LLVFGLFVCALKHSKRWGKLLPSKLENDVALSFGTISTFSKNVVQTISEME
jgi:hypothetical protein